MTPAHFHFLLGILMLPAGLTAIIMALFFGASPAASLCLALFTLWVYASLSVVEPPTPKAA